MEIKPIKTKADHRAALKEVEGLMSARQGTRDGERLDVLVTLIEARERKRFPMELPDPIEAICFSMEQKGLRAKDLTPMIGQINRVYEVLNGRRPLTLPMSGIPDQRNRRMAGCLNAEPSVLLIFAAPLFTLPFYLSPFPFPLTSLAWLWLLAPSRPY